MKERSNKVEEILMAAFGMKKQIQEEIKKKEEKTGEKITKSQKIVIKNRVKAKYKRAKIRVGILAAMGITAGTVALLPKGETEPQPQVKSEAKIENAKLQRRAFTEELKFNSETVNLVDLNKEEEQVKEYIEDEINGLRDEQAVLDYMKGFYIDEYNNINDTQYAKEQVELYRSRELGPAWVVRATINNNSDQIVNSAFRDNFGNCHTCIVNREREVIQLEDDFMSELAPVLSAGISHRAAMNNEYDTNAEKEEFRDRFIDEMSNYVIASKGITYENIVEKIEENQKLSSAKEIGD